MNFIGIFWINLNINWQKIPNTLWFNWSSNTGPIFLPFTIVLKFLVTLLNFGFYLLQNIRIQHISSTYSFIRKNSQINARKKFTNFLISIHVLFNIVAFSIMLFNLCIYFICGCSIFLNNKPLVKFSSYHILKDSLSTIDWHFLTIWLWWWNF